LIVIYWAGLFVKVGFESELFMIILSFLDLMIIKLGYSFENYTVKSTYGFSHNDK